MRINAPIYANIDSIDEFRKNTDNFSRPIIVQYDPKLLCFTRIIDSFPDIEECFSSLLYNRANETITRNAFKAYNNYNYIFDLFVHRGNLIVEKDSPNFHDQIKTFTENCTKVPLLKEKIQIGKEILNQPDFDILYNEILQMRGVNCGSVVPISIRGVPINIHAFYSGEGNIVTPLHVDPEYVSNMTFQLQGKKEWILIDPKYQLSLNHLMTKEFLIVKNSIKDIAHYRITVEEGQLLFIPRKWLHTVRQGLGKNLSIGFFIFEE